MANNVLQTNESLPELPEGGPLNMVLIGKTGQGKSDTGNTILGQERFVASDNAFSTTKINQSVKLTVGGRVLNVVDTPGCMDTKEGDKILQEIADTVTTHPEGYDAFLIVLKYPIKMTEEEVKTIHQLQELFGEEVYNYAVVVFTHGDSFDTKQKKNQKQGKTAMTFQQYLERDLKSGDNSYLGPLLRKVGNRVVMFNNMEDDKCKKRAMAIDLVNKIDSSGRRQRYDNHIFKKARELKEKLPSEKERSKRLFSYLKKMISSCAIM